MGGIGPEASAEFYSKLLKKLQDSGLIRSNLDYPQIIINSIPAPELIQDLISEKDLDEYRRGLEELDRLKPDFIVMVCNTIHLYLDYLSRFVKAPILDLRNAVKNELINKNYKKIFLLGTKNTLKQGLYDFDSINSLVPSLAEQDNLEKAIFYYNSGIAKQKQKAIVEKICKKYLDLGAETIILGCTEFALMLEKSDIPKISTINILVDATFQNYTIERRLEEK